MVNYIDTDFAPKEGSNVTKHTRIVLQFDQNH